MEQDITIIWNEYHDKLHRFIENRVKDKFLADDILQEVFIKIYSRINTLRDTDKLQSWMFQITRNALIDHYREHKKTESLPEESISTEWEPSKSEDEELSSCLMSLINSLPEKYGEALIMSEIDGLKQKEVAEKQGVSLSNAKIRVQRGRAMIKDLLTEGCQLEVDRKGKITGFDETEGKCNAC